MNIRTLLTTVAAALLTLTGTLTAAAPAGAAPCPNGSFCAWTEADYQGQQESWKSSDREWDATLASNDSSWANHGIETEGVPSHVRIYDEAELGGDMTLCLSPGQEVSTDATADNRGSSHEWATSC
ncbi:peptidase inhibitor family I36 protein [Streptomyces sp. NPDC126514]|uniref:peptidase inhibitor family I36 protein n=1 Tax=Streptomyces sp. NPDC126514 TaxID=3155210 RepID=UPI00331F5248